MVVKDFDADVFALIQCVYTCKEDENAEQQAVREPAPKKILLDLSTTLSTQLKNLSTI
jgi:hypothetical protein